MAKEISSIEWRTERFEPTRQGTRADLVVPNDSTDFAEFPRDMRVNGAGDIVFIPAGNDSSVTWTVSSGEWLSMRVRRVLATGTTATNIYAVY